MDHVTPASDTPNGPSATGPSASHGRRRGRSQTREQILDAATAVLREQGIGRATTREIARAAGYSEAALYKHFTDKIDLLLCVLRERSPEFIDDMKQLSRKVGAAPVEQTLVELARKAVVFYTDGMPMFGSLFSDPALLSGQRTALRAQGVGPHLANQALADYLTAEHRAGRISSDVSPYAVASLLLGACFQRAFLSTLIGEDLLPGTTEEFATGLVIALLRGAGPAGSP